MLKSIQISVYTRGGRILLKQFRPVLWMAGALTIISLLALAVLAPYFQPESHRFTASLPAPISAPQILRSEISTALGRQRLSREAVASGFIPIHIHNKTYQAKLSLDYELQRRIESLYERYDPVFAAFVAIDPDTGRVLAMADYSNEGHSENLVLHATYPTASVFKVITSAAALEERKVSANSLVSYNGANTTLYKRNLRDEVNRWTRFTSVQEALAKSINTVFGKIAANRLGQQVLQKYADRFGFNQPVVFDMPVDASSVIVPEDLYGIAETGSGYTKRNTMSPLQGALIAASVISQGQMPNPYLVQEVLDETGASVYQANPQTIRRPIDAQTAHTLSQMMEQTIRSGTARKEYRDYDHHPVLDRKSVV